MADIVTMYYTEHSSYGGGSSVSSSGSTAAVKSLHPNMCIAVHCSISLHPQLPWYHESAHHWEVCGQV